MIQKETHHFRGNQARLWRSLITLTLIAWPLTPLVFYAQTAEAETTPSTLRSRADYLRHAAERCQQRIDSGELDECTVIVTWDNNREISIEEAETYAARLTKSACITDAGMVLNNDLQSCAGGSQSCLENSGLGTGPAYCAATCLAAIVTDTTWAGCLLGCGIPASQLSNIPLQCESNATNCKEKALRDDKHRRFNC